ncbi:hypothetical protein MKEN_01116500 [Mycena kentingensis (nom. inval.)]|nr:hypothetical protein MKEN_01116500 [Mycena kentingensis (nom. inval.)]
MDDETRPLPSTLSSALSEQTEVIVPLFQGTTNAGTSGGTIVSVVQQAVNEQDTTLFRDYRAIPLRDIALRAEIDLDAKCEHGAVRRRKPQRKVHSVRVRNWSVAISSSRRLAEDVHTLLSFSEAKMRLEGFCGQNYDKFSHPNLRAVHAARAFDPHSFDDVAQALGYPRFELIAPSKSRIRAFYFFDENWHEGDTSIGDLFEIVDASVREFGTTEVDPSSLSAGDTRNILPSLRDFEYTKAYSHPTSDSAFRSPHPNGHFAGQGDGDSDAHGPGETWLAKDQPSKNVVQGVGGHNNINNVNIHYPGSTSGGFFAIAITGWGSLSDSATHTRVVKTLDRSPPITLSESTVVLAVVVLTLLVSLLGNFLA